MNYKKYHRDSDYTKMEETFRNIFLMRYRLIMNFVDYRGRVLDIGCSNGIFLDLYKGNFFETWGVEPSLNAKKANAKKHKIINTTIERANLPENYFDLVIMNHTLEHIIDPGKVLLKVKKTLKKGGILFIDVPNVGSLSSKILGKRWPYLLPEEHLWQFDRKILTNLVEKTGYKVLHWESRSGIFEYSNPFLEFRRKKFLIDMATIPYSFVATALSMGDSQSIIAKKL